MKILRIVMLCIGLNVFNQAYASCNDDSCSKANYCTQAGDWFTRLRALYVLPNDSSGSVSSIPHSGVSVHPSWTGEFDFGAHFEYLQTYAHGRKISIRD